MAKAEIKVVVLRESLAVSAASDAITLVTLAVCLWLSVWVDSTVFSVICGVMFLWSLIARVLRIVGASGGRKTPAEAIEYIKSLEAE